MLSYNLNVSTANSFKQLLLKQTPSAPAVGAKKFFHLSEILLFTLIVYLSLFPCLISSLHLSNIDLSLLYISLISSLSNI